MGNRNHPSLLKIRIEKVKEWFQELVDAIIVSSLLTLIMGVAMLSFYCDYAWKGILNG